VLRVSGRLTRPRRRVRHGGTPGRGFRSPDGPQHPPSPQIREGSSGFTPGRGFRSPDGLHQPPSPKSTCPGGHQRGMKSFWPPSGRRFALCRVCSLRRVGGALRQPVRVPGGCRTWMLVLHRAYARDGGLSS